MINFVTRNVILLQFVNSSKSEKSTFVKQFRILNFNKIKKKHKKFDIISFYFRF